MNAVTTCTIRNLMTYDATGETVAASKKGCRECEYPTSPVALSLGDRLQNSSTIYPDAQRLT